MTEIGLTAKVKPEVDPAQADAEATALREVFTEAVSGLEPTFDTGGQQSQGGGGGGGGGGRSGSAGTRRVSIESYGSLSAADMFIDQLNAIQNISNGVERATEAIKSQAGAGSGGDGLPGSGAGQEAVDRADGLLPGEDGGGMSIGGQSLIPDGGTQMMGGEALSQVRVPPESMQQQIESMGLFAGDRSQQDSGGGGLGGVMPQGGLTGDSSGTFGEIGSQISGMADNLANSMRTRQLTNNLLKGGAVVSIAGLALFGIQQIMKGVKKLSDASPLLGSVLQIFNTAMMLFFRPFARFLGRLLMPLAVALLDFAVDFTRFMGVIENKLFSQGAGVAAIRILGLAVLVKRFRSLLIGAVRKAGSRLVAVAVNAVKGLGGRILSKLGLQGAGKGLAKSLIRPITAQIGKSAIGRTILKALSTRIIPALAGGLPGTILSAIFAIDLAAELLLGFSPIFDTLIPGLIDGFQGLTDFLGGLELPEIDTDLSGGDIGSLIPDMSGMLDFGDSDGNPVTNPVAGAAPTAMLGTGLIGPLTNMSQSLAGGKPLSEQIGKTFREVLGVDLIPAITPLQTFLRLISNFLLTIKEKITSVADFFTSDEDEKSPFEKALSDLPSAIKEAIGGGIFSSGDSEGESGGSGSGFGGLKDRIFGTITDSIPAFTIYETVSESFDGWPNDVISEFDIYETVTDEFEGWPNRDILGFDIYETVKEKFDGWPETLSFSVYQEIRDLFPGWPNVDDFTVYDEIRDLFPGWPSGIDTFSVYETIRGLFPGWPAGIDDFNVYDSITGLFPGWPDASVLQNFNVYDEIKGLFNGWPNNLIGNFTLYEDVKNLFDVPDIDPWPGWDYFIDFVPDVLSNQSSDTGSNTGNTQTDTGFNPLDLVPDTGAATGGLVDETGKAVIHEGERVVPDAQISDRGGLDSIELNIPDSVGASDATGLEGGETASNLQAEMSGVRDAIESLAAQLRRSNGDEPVKVMADDKVLAEIGSDGTDRYKLTREVTR